MIVVTMITLIQNTYLTADFINYRYLNNHHVRKEMLSVLSNYSLWIKKIST